MPAIARALTAAVAAAAAAVALAQPGKPGAEAPAPASRWSAQSAQMDDAMRAQWLVATGPRTDWLAGTLDTGDPAAQVTRLASARVATPDNRLFLASLATACLAPLRPRPAECDATDRLADWATRDVDNGVPSLLLADRARQRNNPAALLAYLEEAAQRPRFDDYRNRGALVIWEEVRALPGAYDPAARALLAASYGALWSPFAAGAVDGLCRDGQAPTDAIRAACAAAGAAMAQRAATWSLRIAGARLAERSAAPGPARTAAGQRLADLQRQSYECAETGNAIAAGLESADAAARARAVAQWEARLVRDARDGEVASCLHSAPAAALQPSVRSAAR
ncbi:MAG: hypothetical protein U1F58_10530 [Burkholderiales bacterium]